MITEAYDAPARKSDFDEQKGIMKKLAEAQSARKLAMKRLAETLDATRDAPRDLLKSMEYAFQNQVYRHLPGILKEKYHITVKERLIRTDIAGEEVNIFARAERDGKEVLIIGEAKLSLDGKKTEEAFAQLEEKVRKAAQEYGPVEVVKLIATHYASRDSLRWARDKGVIIVQSFEW